ncbi:hypothetical protein EDC04DRAFT_1875672 [Pisolithus marmoratus]|nr:hypothetical protein EDC04DRAFT_1875672 [Pisolithus marmoratus]
MELTVSQHGLPVLFDLTAAFESAFECLLSIITLVILRRIAHHKHVSLLPIFCLVTVLIICELVFSVVPQTPFLLSPFLAATSRVLSFALLSYIVVARLPDTRRILLGNEKRKPDRYPQRVSSPTTETWPFPASLGRRQTKADKQTSPINTTAAPPAGATTKNDSSRIPLAFALSQILALLCAALDIVLDVIVGHMATEFNFAKAGSAVLSRLLDFYIARAAVTCAWSVALLIAIHVMPPTLVSGPPAQEPLQSKQPTIPKCGIHTSKSSFSRFAYSDSASDYLFVPDPFASMPPPRLPPPAAALELDLDEVKAREIGIQYRFAAPLAKGRRRAEHKKSRSTSRKEALKHQNSTEPFIPRYHHPFNICLHTGVACEMDEDRDRSLGDEAILTQLFLQSLDQDMTTSEICGLSTRGGARASTPQPEQKPLRSHWSSSSTLKSTRALSRYSSGHRSGISFATSERQLKRCGSIDMTSTGVPPSCPSSVGACECEGGFGTTKATSTSYTPSAERVV